MSDIWTAWTRDKKRMVGSGRTFDEAKQAAAAAGESSVLLAKSSPAKRWSYVVAVFVALVPGSSLSIGSSDDSAASVDNQSSADFSLDQIDDDR